MAAENRTGQAARPRWMTVVVMVAVALQCLVLFATFLLGLGWGGWTYGLALLVGLGCLLLLLVVGFRTRRPAVVAGLLLVPFLSAACSWSLESVGVQQLEDAACSAAERDAVEGLGPVAGRSAVFEGTVDGDCLWRLSADPPLEPVVDELGAQLEGAGWRPDPERDLAFTRGEVVISLEPAVGERMVLVSVWDGEQ